MRRLVGVVLCAAVAVAQEAVYSGPPYGSPPYEHDAAGRGPFVVDGNRAFFVADSGTGYELHVTDGTATGTRLVIDLATGPESGAQRAVAMLGSQVVVESTQGGYWLTDGTNAGTLRLASIPAITRALGSIGGRLVYAWIDPNSNHLWATYSLSAAGQIETLSPSPGNTLVAFGNSTYLIASGQLYRTDGTSSGTHLILSSQADLTLSRGAFWYFAELPGFHLGLFTFNPLTNSTSQNLMPPGFAIPSKAIPTPAGVVFRIGNLPDQLWASDGTVAGTRRITVPFDDVLSISPWRDRALLFAHDPVNDVQPWVTDGTEAGTYMLCNVSPAHFVPWHFATTPQGTTFAIQNGQGSRLLFTDGTLTGTRIVSDHAGTISNLTALGSQVLFLDGRPLATDAAMTTSNRLLASVARRGYLTLQPSAVSIGGSLVFGEAYTMQSKGTTATRIAGRPWMSITPLPHRHTFGIADDTLIVPTWESGGLPVRRWDSATGSLGLVRQSNQPVTAIASHHDRVFLADDELVITDGASSLQTRAFPYSPVFVDSLAVTNGHVFATFPDVQALDFVTGTWTQIDWNISVLVGALGERAIYRTGSLLHASDGGPPESLGISVPATGALPTLFTWNGEHWLFGNDLWSTDGTAAGSHAHLPPAGVTFGDAAALEDGIYLVGSTAAHGKELWKYDGATFTRVTDLIPGFRDSVFSVATCGDRLFLAASDGTDGIEPYISDGTAAGTHRIADLMPGLTSSLPEFVRIAGDFAYFTALTPGFRNLMSVPLGQLGVAHSERIGQGCSGRNGIPQLGTPNPPRLGDPAFRFELTRGAPFAPVIFATDTTTTLLQLGPCRLRCGGGLGVVFRATNGAGTSSWTQSIPNAPQLLGLHLTAQAAVLDSFAAGPGFALSTTLGCVVGAP